MHRRSFLTGMLAAPLALHAETLNACSRVFVNDRAVAKVVVRSMDLPPSIKERPRFVVFPRGTARAARNSVLPGLPYKIDGAGPNGMDWVSQFGSVVITTCDVGVSDGLNEKGLAAHVLELSDAKHAPPDGRPELPTLLWVQYVLDNFTTVKDVVEAHRSGTFCVVPSSSAEADCPPGMGVHLAVEDETGDSGVFEYIDGELVIHHGPDYRVLTNEPPLDEMLARLKKYKPFGGTEELPGTIDPDARFARLAAMYKFLPNPATYEEAVAGAVSLIRVAQVPFRDPSRAEAGEGIWGGERTVWISAADVTNKIYYVNGATSPSVFWLDLDDVKLDPGADILFLDPLDTQVGGDARPFLKPWRGPA